MSLEKLPTKRLENELIQAQNIIERIINSKKLGRNNMEAVYRRDTDCDSEHNAAA